MDEAAVNTPLAAQEVLRLLEWALSASHPEVQRAPGEAPGSGEQDDRGQQRFPSAGHGGSLPALIMTALPHGRK